VSARPVAFDAYKAQGGSGYWDDGGWGGDRSVGAALKAKVARRQTSQRTPKDSPSGSMDGRKSDGQMSETNSESYWDAGQWDPDERVYVGAEDGARHHCRAIDPSQHDIAGSGAKLSGAWAGGLLAMELGLAEGVGPPIDLSLTLGEGRPTLKDAFDMLSKALGSGSFGVVRHAKHRATDAVCVVKAVRKTSVGDQYRTNLVEHGLGEKLLRMTREAPHENITRYFDMLEGPTHFYVIMEELTGPELMQYMEDLFPVTEAFIHKVMKQILSSLAHLHDIVHLFHRDVKLANYRFRGSVEDSPLVLLDFGFASSTERPWDGDVCGTPMFMSPELVAHTTQAPYLQAVDVWAAGVILFVLLTGDSPFEDDDVKAWKEPGTVKNAHDLVELALANDELKAASAQAVSLLRELLHVDPVRRIAAARALEHAWFADAPSPSQRLSVSGDRYRMVRSRSGMSEARAPVRRLTSGPLLKSRSRSTPNLECRRSSLRRSSASGSCGIAGASPLPVIHTPTATQDVKDDFPDIPLSAGLTRIISAGSAEEHEDAELLAAG